MGAGYGRSGGHPVVYVRTPVLMCRGTKELEQVRGIATVIRPGGNGNGLFEKI